MLFFARETTPQHPVDGRKHGPLFSFVKICCGLVLRPSKAGTDAPHLSPNLNPLEVFAQIQPLQAMTMSTILLAALSLLASMHMSSAFVAGTAPQLSRSAGSILALRCASGDEKPSMPRRAALATLAVGLVAFTEASSAAFAPVKPTAAELNGVLAYKPQWEHILDQRPSVAKAKMDARRIRAGSEGCAAACSGCALCDK